VIDELRDQAKPAELKFAPIEEYFERIESVKESLPPIAEELQHHASGCYSALSRIKELNRKTEEALIAAEKYNFMASTLAGMEYLSDQLYRGWTNLLFCQFHDVLAGTCIKEAYEGDVYPMLEEALSVATRVSNLSTQTVTSRIKIRKKSIIVFNPNAFQLRAPLEVNWIRKDPPSWLLDENGTLIRCQVGEGSALVSGVSSVVFVADIPALGYRVFEPSSVGEGETGDGELIAREYYMENRWLRIELGRTDGSISRLVLKDREDQNIIKDGAMALVINDESDTWSHGVFRFDDVIGQFSCEQIDIIERGPVRARIRAQHRYGSSTIRQDFMLYKDLDYVICRASVDWHEKRKMLKVAFPVDVSEPEATYEIPYGLVTRPTDGEEEPGLRWVDLTGKTDSKSLFGLTLINDSKYSYDASGNVLRLTVLRSPAFAHHHPMKLESRSDCEYIDQGNNSFTYILRPHRGGFKPWEAARIADVLTAGPLALIESEHDGKLAAQVSLASVSEESIILKVVKRSEQLDNWVLRLYETTGKHAKTRISLPTLGLAFEADFKPYEIKTYSISLEAKTARETDMIEE